MVSLLHLLCRVVRAVVMRVRPCAASGRSNTGTPPRVAGLMYRSGPRVFFVVRRSISATRSAAPPRRAPHGLGRWSVCLGWAGQVGQPAPTCAISSVCCPASPRSSLRVIGGTPARSWPRAAAGRWRGPGRCRRGQGSRAIAWPFPALVALALTGSLPRRVLEDAVEALRIAERTVSSPHAPRTRRQRDLQVLKASGSRAYSRRRPASFR